VCNTPEPTLTPDGSSGTSDGDGGGSSGLVIALVAVSFLVANIAVVVNTKKGNTRKNAESNKWTANQGAPPTMQQEEATAGSSGGGGGGLVQNRTFVGGSGMAAELGLVADSDS